MSHLNLPALACDGCGCGCAGEKFARFCAAVEKLSVIAERKGATMVELATGWVLRQVRHTNAWLASA